MNANKIAASVLPTLAILLLPAVVADPGPSRTHLLSPVADGTPSQSVVKPSPAYRIRETRIVQNSDHQVTIHHVAPPPEALLLLGRPLQSPTLAREQQPLINGIQRPPEPEPGSDLELIHCSATVYHGGVTHFRWWHEGEAFSGWSGVDFQNLSGFSHFRHGDRTYGLIMGIGLEDARPPATAILPTDPHSFVLESGNQSDTAALEIAEALHSLFKAEKETLVAARRGREAAAARAAATPPAPPADVTLRFWDLPSRPFPPAVKEVAR